MLHPMGIEEFGGGQAQGSDILVVTTNDAPGFRVERVIGEVFGLTVRSRHLGSQIGVGLKSMVGGELKVLTMRFDVSEAADIGTEVCAYGTAVVLAPADAA